MYITKAADRRKELVQDGEHITLLILSEEIYVCLSKKLGCQ